MIKKKYESPEAEIEKFDLMPVFTITLSNEGGIDAGGDEYDGGDEFDF